MQVIPVYFEDLDDLPAEGTFDSEGNDFDITFDELILSLKTETTSPFLGINLALLPVCSVVGFTGTAMDFELTFSFTIVIFLTIGVGLGLEVGCLAKVLFWTFPEKPTLFNLCSRKGFFFARSLPTGLDF